MVLVREPKANAELVRTVTKQLWQCVQGYMGDLALSYPAMLAQASRFLSHPIISFPYLQQHG